MKLAKEVDLAHVAELTIGYMGADIASLCREAAFVALKRTFGHSYNEILDHSNLQSALEGN